MANNKAFGQEATGVYSPIEYETFGRVGNSESGQAFNRREKPDQTMRVDTTSDALYIYIGYAIPATAETTANWKIKRYTKSSGTMLYANGSPLYNNKWSERITPITYS